MLGGLSGDVVIAELVEERHVGQVAGETPGGGAVQTGGGEGVEAQLIGAGVDVVGHGLQGGEVGDLVERSGRPASSRALFTMMPKAS